MADKPAYTVNEAYEVVGIGRFRMYELLSAGAIRAEREGDRRLILRAELDGYPVSLPTRLRVEFGARAGAGDKSRAPASGPG